PSQPQPFALLMLSADAQQALTNNADLREALTAEFEVLLAQVNDTLEDHEKLDYVILVQQPWTIESGFLTPTMKIKRDVIESCYLPNAEAWQARRQKVIWE
ncbi:MAG: hypothetical protein Q7J80_08810, partial [Anaerolineales bacterium]|nr:hypothetical protein [Anaerolineales bacterium]